MGVDRYRFRVGICPSPGKRKGREWRTPVAMEQSYDAVTNRLTIRVRLLKQGRIKPDKVLILKLCPEGHVCGCDYEAEVGWQILESCAGQFTWLWPEDAGCLLKQGSLVGSLSGVAHIEQLGADPGNAIYPVGDERNPDCPGCGLSDNQGVSVVDTPVPGEQFILAGCFDEEACLETYGVGGCRPIGDELFQTVGFMGGLIHDIFDEAARVYEVWVDGVLTGAKGTDLTKYTIGQWVALAKVGTDFPIEGPYEQRATVTNVNVPTVGVEEYIIIPYQFAGVA